MSNVYKLNRKCSKCSIKITDKNKSGLSLVHVDKSGKNNSFYGKKHSIEVINIIKEKCKLASEKLWKDSNYRQKVIKNSSKPRKPSFKIEQSKRIIQWYKDNPNQKQIRSIAMKRSWNNGKIPISTNISQNKNKSKIQQIFFNELLKVLPGCIDNYVIHIDKNWFYPDVTIDGGRNGILIEFLGDYWHANPKKYKENDIIHHGITAKKIWEKDEKRFKKLSDKGYRIIKIWESDYKKNKQDIIHDLDMFLNWESCALW